MISRCILNRTRVAKRAVCDASHQNPRSARRELEKPNRPVRRVLCTSGLRARTKRAEPPVTAVAAAAAAAAAGKDDAAALMFMFCCVLALLPRSRFSQCPFISVQLVISIENAWQCYSTMVAE